MYEKIAASETLFWVVAGLIFGFGIVASMIGATVRDMFLDWRDDRREARYEEQEMRPVGKQQEAKRDITRIMSGLYPDRYESEITNEQYFAPGRTLSDKWRDFAEECRPRSPEVVAETVYRERTSQFTPVRAELARSWPEWTPQELATAGRHRAEDRNGKPFLADVTEALNTSTGSYPLIERRELVTV